MPFQSDAIHHSFYRCVDDFHQQHKRHGEQQDEGFNPALADQFQAFFGRSDTFALGICNGCQMMAALSPIIPGAEAWPKFTRNKSEQFEARLAQVEVLESPSIFFQGMAGSRLPIATAHGEGFADFSQRGDAATCDVLDIIYRDEIGHVQTGNNWYGYLCAERGLEPVALFRALISRYDLFIFRGHVNIEARERAGFSRFELAMLENFEQSRKAQPQERNWRQALGR